MINKFRTYNMRLYVHGHGGGINTTGDNKIIGTQLHRCFDLVSRKSNKKKIDTEYVQLQCSTIYVTIVTLMCAIDWDISISLSVSVSAGLTLPVEEQKLILFNNKIGQIVS